ncbi:MAG: short-chain dehydrogenase/reductase [Rhizobium sp.]|nr:MAG: short-chain dehydrogenase/reductase [Rhizobium sp.]
MTQTIIITGTSSGLGRATAKLFQTRGWNVVATMRSPEKETELSALNQTLVTRLDVEDADSIAAAVEAGISTFGRIDALVNNAGYGAYGPLEATPRDQIRRQFDVNVLGLLATTQALLPHFRANRAGTIINVSSMGGRVAFPLGTLYHATKFAVEGLSESLSYELAAIGVRVKLVEPGLMATDFGGRSLAFSNDPSLTEYQPTVESVMGAFGSAMKQAARPETVAESVYQAAIDGTDRLRFVAGADAQQMIDIRRDVDDQAFMAGIKTQFGLDA